MGLSDNLLLSIVRAWDYEKPLLVAPAMNTLMWNHPATVLHLRTLQQWGVRVIYPVSKVLACKDEGKNGLVNVDPPCLLHSLMSIAIPLCFAREWRLSCRGYHCV